MKKVFAYALLTGALLAPMSSTEAYHVIKQHRNYQPVIQEQTEPVVAESNRNFSASATARTDRNLLSEDTPASIYSDNSIQTSSQVKPGKGEYLMRGGDQLRITVYGHEDLSSRPDNSTTQFVVRPDGILSFPLIGEIQCAGKPVSQVTQEITNRLSEYIIDPQVTINISKLGTTRVYVLGEVKAQGLYELEKSHRLIDAVARAGGFTQKSAKRKVYVVREGVNDFVTQVNMEDLVKKGIGKANIELQEGDCVYLSSNHKIGLSAILSAVYSIVSSWDKADDISN